MEDLFEYRKISFVVRAEDRKKMIQSFLALSLSNFEMAGKEYVIEVSKSILEGSPEVAKQKLDKYIQYIEEYRQNAELVSKLIDSHLVEDDHRTKVVFAPGVPMSIEEVNEKFQEATKEKTTRKKKRTRKAAEAEE